MIAICGPEICGGSRICTQSITGGDAFCESAGLTCMQPIECRLMTIATSPAVTPTSGLASSVSRTVTASSPPAATASSCQRDSAARRTSPARISATSSVSRRPPPLTGQEGVRSTGWPRRIESTVGADARRRAGRRIERRSSPFDERLLPGSPQRVHPGGTWQPADTGSDLSRGCNYRRPRPLLCTGPGGASRWGHQLNPRTPHRWCTSRSRQIGSLLSRRRHRPVSRRI